ncbi:hypothetical protein Tco_0510414 [Tanacetum coccineum]
MANTRGPRVKTNLRENDDSDDVTNNDDDVDSGADGDNEAKEYIRTPDNIEFFGDEEYEKLNKDVNVRLKDAGHEEEGKGDEKMTDARRDDVSQEKSHEQVEDDAHVTLIAAHVRRLKVQCKALLFHPTLPVNFLTWITFHQLSINTRLEDSIQKAFWSYTAEFEKKSQGEKKRYIDLVEKSVKDIIKLEKDLFESYGKAYSLKRDCEDNDKDEDPPVGSDQGLKRRKTSKDVEPSKGSESKKSKSSSFKGTKSQPKSSGKKSVDFRPPQTWINRIAQAEKPPLTFNELMSTPIDFSAYVMNNPNIDNIKQDHLVGQAFNLLKGTCRRQEYPFDLRKPLPLIKDRGRQGFPIGYFINKDLEVSKHDVFSIKRIIVVTHVKVMKLYDYGYLKEIEVRKEDQMLYKFKEERDVIFELNVALRMFTRCVVILKRVEDLQLGVESYQKKLNITKPETFRMDYLPKRGWSNLDKQRSRIMIKAIDKLQLQRRLMRILEKFIGGREYGEDFRLHERTI